MEEETAEKITKAEFFESVARYIDYWNRQDITTDEKLTGLAFSIMYLLDNNGLANEIADGAMLHHDWCRFSVGRATKD